MTLPATLAAPADPAASIDALIGLLVAVFIASAGLSAYLALRDRRR